MSFYDHRTSDYYGWVDVCEKHRGRRGTRRAAPLGPRACVQSEEPTIDPVHKAILAKSELSLVLAPHELLAVAVESAADNNSMAHNP